MKWYHALFILIFSLLSSTLFGQQDSMIIGEFDRSVMQESPYVEWYVTEFETYDVDQTSLKKINALNGIEILICLGTWCSDSRREVPRFLKILDVLEIEPDQFELIGLDRQKSAPDFAADDWNIEFVPTFIVLRDGQEIGRIIESPQLSLEEDLLNILK